MMFFCNVLFAVLAITIVVEARRTCTLLSGGTCRYKCCGPGYYVHCLKDCTGAKCTSDYDCQGECCLPSAGNAYEKHCGTCTKKRHCFIYSGSEICRLKCCGPVTNLYCLATCNGRSCSSSVDWDGGYCNPTTNTCQAGSSASKTDSKIFVSVALVGFVLSLITGNH